MYDVIIIGAGVIGCAIARELARYQAKILVLEKESDVCEGTSKANSGIIHAGYDAEPGSLKAKLNVLGNQRMSEITKELEVPFYRNGSIVVCFHEEDKSKLQKLYDQGIANGVPDLSILDGDELRKMEPNLSPEIKAGLVAKTAGVICPFELTIALAENAYENGVEFAFSTQVTNITKSQHYIVTTANQTYTTKAVINAAGVYADEIHNMICHNKINITARKGEYCLFDKDMKDLLTHTVFQLPSKLGKGILVTKTVHGNVLIGPTAVDTLDKEEVMTTASGLEEIIEKASNSISHLNTRKVITSFAGLRAHEEHGDFIIEESKECKNFFDVAGIESPGLTSACAISLMVCEMVQKELKLSEKSVFQPNRKAMVRVNELQLEERIRFVNDNPLYGNIICRCEMISEGEIRDAIRRPLGATTLDGIKRRTRAMMGRCQAGFCTSKIMDILAQELSMKKEQITKHGKDSNLLMN